MTDTSTTPKAFAYWQEQEGLSDRQTAAVLDVNRDSVVFWRHGARRNGHVLDTVPAPVGLAIAAVYCHLRPWGLTHGFEEGDPAALKAWRSHMGVTQEQAAELIGVKYRTYQYWEEGVRDGKPQSPSRLVMLACSALAEEVKPWRDEGPADFRPKLAARVPAWARTD